MKPSLEGGFHAAGAGMGVVGRPSETGSRGVHSDRNRLETRAGSIVRQEKTGNVNFPDGFGRFGLGFYWGFLFVMSCL